MKPWTWALGLGAACVACCAVPLLSAPAALFIGAASLAAAGTALRACTGEFGLLFLLLPALGTVGAGVALWHRKRQRRDCCVPGECR